MNNLPTISHKSQPAGNAANARPANFTADSLATATQSVDPFAFLLAQQIGEAGLSSQDAALATIAIGGNSQDSDTGRILEDAQDPAAIANMQGDPSGMITAILKQISVPEDNGQKADTLQAAQHLTPDPSQKPDGSQAMPSFTLNPVQQTGGSQTTREYSPEAGHNRSAASLSGDQKMQPPPADQSPADQFSPNAVKHLELPLNPVQPAQTSTQTIAPQPAYAVMPGAATNNIAPIGTAPTVSTPLGHNGWADEFSQKVSWISTQHNQVAELHLNPPNLGPLDVVIKISDNQATALFASPHGAVRDAVENALPKLREILADNGIMLGNTTISDQSPRDRGTDGYMGQGFGTETQQETGNNEPELAGTSLAAGQAAPVRRHNGMVDTYA